MLLNKTHNHSLAYALSNSGLTDSGKISIALAKEGVKKGSGFGTFVVEELPYTADEIKYRGTIISTKKIEEKGRVYVLVHHLDFQKIDVANALSKVAAKEYGYGWVAMPERENTGSLEELQRIINEAGLSALYTGCFILKRPEEDVLEAHHDLYIATDAKRFKILTESKSYDRNFGKFMDYPENDIVNDDEDILSEAFYSKKEIKDLIKTGTIPDSVLLFSHIIRKRGNGFPEEETELAGR